MSRRASLRMCALPMRRLVMTPSRDGVSGGRLCQLANMQPLAKRLPRSRLARKSALAWIRLDLGKLVSWPEAVICAGKGRQAGVSRVRPRARRPARILRPALVAMRARKPCLRLRLIFDG